MERKTSQYERRTKTPEQALGSLMRLASKSEKSSGDALRLMHGWGVDPSERHKILQTLIDKRFIDDRRYAAAYVREKSRLNGWGSYKIRRTLVAKGIAKPVIDETLGQVEAAVSKDKLAAMLARKMKSAKAQDTYQMKGRLMRYGLSLGYDYEDVICAVETVVKEKD